MRDPADVIADALYRLGLDQGNDAANGAVDVLLALRDEYGATVAEIEIESPAPDPNTVYVRKVQKRVIPVPVPEGSAS